MTEQEREALIREIVEALETMTLEQIEFLAEELKLILKHTPKE